MKLVTVCLLSLSLIAPQLAAAKDIFGRGEKFIKITEDGPQNAFIRFELCYLKKPDFCTQIGSRYFYSKTELVNLRNSEKKDIALAALADVGIVVVAVYGGAVAGAVLAAGGGVAPMVGASAGVVLGTAGSAAIINGLNSVNPVEQYRQVVILQDDVIEDKKVVIDRDIDKIAHTLNTVLSNLD